MAYELDALDNELQSSFENIDDNIASKPFAYNYDAWYTKSLKSIRAIAPERLDDFISQYKVSKSRKEVKFGSYVIEDYLLGLTVNRGGKEIVGPRGALQKMKHQVNIVRACAELATSSLRDIEGLVAADLFDSEISSAEELAKRGFFRASGAVSGVVLERHLKIVAASHGFKSQKKNPTISDFNEHLRQSGAIGQPEWRRIQHLGDIRNLCDHPKDREPTKDDAMELAEGVKRILKTVI